MLIPQETPFPTVDELRITPEHMEAMQAARQRHREEWLRKHPELAAHQSLKDRVATLEQRMDALEHNVGVSQRNH